VARFAYRHHADICSTLPYTGWRTKCHTIDCARNTFLLLQKHLTPGTEWAGKLFLMKNMFDVTTVLPHNLLQTNPCIHHNFSTQVFRKRAAQLHYVGPEQLVPNEEHVQCDHRFASQPLANEPLHSSQLFDTSLQKAHGTTSLCGP